MILTSYAQILSLLVSLLTLILVGYLCTRELDSQLPHLAAGSAQAHCRPTPIDSGVPTLSPAPTAAYSANGIALQRQKFLELFKLATASWDTLGTADVKIVLPYLARTVYSQARLRFSLDMTNSVAPVRASLSLL